MVGECARRVLEQGGRLAIRPAGGHRPGALGARLRPVLPRCPGGELIFHRQGPSIYGGSVHPAARRRGHRPVYRRHRGQLRQCARRQPAVDTPDRAYLPARNNIRHQSRGGGGVVPLHRWLVQPAQDSGRPARTVIRRIRARLLRPTRRTGGRYHRTRARRSLMESLRRSVGISGAAALLHRSVRVGHVVQVLEGVVDEQCATAAVPAFDPENVGCHAELSLSENGDLPEYMPMPQA